MYQLGDRQEPQLYLSRCFSVESCSSPRDFANSNPGPSETRDAFPSHFANSSFAVGSCARFEAWMQGTTFSFSRRSEFIHVFYRSSGNPQ
jgi:hypothetical protein